MEKGNTKQAILDAALDLFSVKGFEATSISMITEAVGIRKASLYSHFASKQAMLDALVERVLVNYNSRSLFARRSGAGLSAGGRAPDLEETLSLIKEHMRYILHDPCVSKARRLLVIEQFQNQELADMQTRQNYTDVMRYFTEIVQTLIRQGVLVDGDAEIMAAQLCLPISAWINLCDREPQREAEVMELVDRHIRQFFRVYGRK